MKVSFALNKQNNARQMSFKDVEAPASFENKITEEEIRAFMNQQALVNKQVLSELKTLNQKFPIEIDIMDIKIKDNVAYTLDDKRFNGIATSTLQNGDTMRLTYNYGRLKHISRSGEVEYEKEYFYDNQGRLSKVIKKDDNGTTTTTTNFKNGKTTTRTLTTPKAEYKSLYKDGKLDEIQKDGVHYADFKDGKLLEIERENGIKISAKDTSYTYGDFYERTNGTIESFEYAVDYSNSDNENETRLYEVYDDDKLKNIPTARSANLTVYKDGSYSSPKKAYMKNAQGVLTFWKQENNLDIESIEFYDDGKIKKITWVRPQYTREVGGYYCGLHVDNAIAETSEYTIIPQTTTFYPNGNVACENIICTGGSSYSDTIVLTRKYSEEENNMLTSISCYKKGRPEKTKTQNIDEAQQARFPRPYHIEKNILPEIQRIVDEKIGEKVN